MEGHFFWVRLFKSSAPGKGVRNRLWYCIKEHPRSQFTQPSPGGGGGSFGLTFGGNKSAKHRRRIKTEEKAKVVAAVWGTELIQFLAALAV